MDEVTEKGYDATEGKGVDVEQNEGTVVSNGGTELSVAPERNSFEEEIVTTQINDADTSQMTDGIEDVKMLASQGNDTLYINNICKLWTKEQVLEVLKSSGVENVEDMLLPDDTKKQGRIKGFALVEFNTQSDAMAAFERLGKSDVVFGLDSSANVAFAQTPIHPNEEVLSQLKTVFMEGLADSWDQEKLNVLCKQYGEVVKVKLSRMLGNKGKNFGYITFGSRESAIACVDGINNTQIGEGEIKVKVSIAQPRTKGKFEKRGKSDRVAHSTKEESAIIIKSGTPETRGHAKSDRAKRKGKIVSQPEFGGGGKPGKSGTFSEGGKHVRAQSKEERANHKRNNLNFSAGGNGKKGSELGHYKDPSKKQGNKQTRQSGNSRKPVRDRYIRKEPDHGAVFVTYNDRYAPRYPGSTVGHQNNGYNTISGSKRPYADMEPHAGYIEPVNPKQGRTYPEYHKPPVGIQYQPGLAYLEHAVVPQSQPRIRFREPDFGTHGRPREGYLEPAVGMQSHQSYAAYPEPAVRRQGQSHAEYYESALGKDGRSIYDLLLRRAGGQDGHSGAPSAYGAGVALPPSYAPIYTSYAPYEGGSRAGVQYQDSGLRLSRRAYQ